MELVSLLCPNCKKEINRGVTDAFLCRSCGYYSIIDEGNLRQVSSVWIKDTQIGEKNVYYASIIKIPIDASRSVAIPLNIHPYNLKTVVKYSSEMFPFNMEYETISPIPDAVYLEPHLSLSAIWSIIPLIMEISEPEDVLLDFNPSFWQILYFPCEERRDVFYSSLLPWNLTKTLVSKELSLKTAVFQSTIDRELLRQHWQETVEVEEKKSLKDIFD